MTASVAVGAPVFKTEAALCAAFIEWAGKHPGVQCFAEWWGWDILLVYPDGFQLGIQAKLRLNAEVIGQALPSDFSWECKDPGPDYRAVLVPDAKAPLWTMAEHLGLIVFRADSYRGGFSPRLVEARRTWVDWNPAKRLDLPPVPTDAIAGSPCPVTLTHWKLGALAVLAELEVKGTIRTRRMKELGVNPGRWLANFWLMPAPTRGEWVRGERCPKFDEQHPTAYAAALKKAREAAA